MSKTIGIDLGTTNSVVAVIGLDGRPQVLDWEGERIVPSVVALSDDGRLLAGRAARNSYAAAPDRAVRSVKRSMGTYARFDLADRPFSPEEISGLILTKMKAIAELSLGEPVGRAVITVPAQFSDAQREATKTAGELAGLEVVRIINEPTAAALAYTAGADVSETVLVYDLGGGTFDVSVVKIEDGVVEVLATAGNNRLGGDDLDRRIVDHVAEYFAREHGIDPRADPKAMARLLFAAERAKIELSDRPFAAVREEFLVQRDGKPLHLDFELTRDRFEGLIVDLIDLTTDLASRALADARLEAGDLDQILLVGGSSRIPAVRRSLEARFGMEPAGTIHPDECVALGAAVQAGIIDGCDIEAILVDVTAHSLGIAALDFTAEERFSVVIPRNTAIPASKTEIYSTVVAGQDSVRIRVFQGEAPALDENLFLGEFELQGLSRTAVAGEPQIAVTFDYDLNGIVQVSAGDRKSKRRGSIEIRDARERMDAAARERARQNVVDLWSRRDDQQDIPASTRRLLARAREAAAQAEAGERERLLAIAAGIEDLFAGGMLDDDQEEQLGRLEDELIDWLQGKS